MICVRCVITILAKLDKIVAATGYTKHRGKVIHG
jgi:hypothetical protein